MSSSKGDSPSWRKDSGPSRNDRIEGTEPAASTFERITGELDPGSSTVIFEKDLAGGDASGLEALEAMVARLGRSVRSTEIRTDPERGKILLIVRLETGRTDEILQECMREGIPGDVLLYAYGSHVEG